MSEQRRLAASIAGWPPLARQLAAFDRFRRRYGWAHVVLSLAVIVPLLANAILLVGYLGAANQRALLSRQVQEAEQMLNDQRQAQQSAPGPTALPGSPTPALPKDVESADMMDIFLRLAQESAVEIVAVDDRGTASQLLGEREYRTFRYHVQLRARVSQLVAFLNRLETTQQNVLSVERLAAGPAGDQNWSVDIELLTFAAPKGA